jgi:hypothetical protein
MMAIISLQEVNTYFSPIAIIAFLSESLLIAIIFLTIKLIVKRKPNQNKHQKMNLKDNEDFTTMLLRKELSDLSKKYDAALETIVKKDEIIKRSEDRIMDLEQQLRSPKTIIDEDTFSEPSFETAQYQYFPSPLSDGSFRKIDGKPQFIEGASIYRFTIISDLEAKFEFCDDKSSVSMALNNRNDLILTVADEMEGSSAGATKILTYKGMLGLVQLEDSKWILKRKAQIKYI